MKWFASIWKEKCPICGEGHVYESKGNVLFFKIPKMNECCSHCQMKFEKEPGYFTGAMYVSYGLCIIEMLLIILIGLLLGYSFDQMFYPVVLVVLLLWTFNFRKSRLIWMNLI